MHYAALRGHVEIVRALLEAGAEKDIQHHAGHGLRGLSSEVCLQPLETCLTRPMFWKRVG